jgi:hypothetical protein
MRELPLDPHDVPYTPEGEEIRRHARELRESRAMDMMLLQEDADYNHAYIPRRPGR